MADELTPAPEEEAADDSVEEVDDPVLDDLGLDDLDIPIPPDTVVTDLVEDKFDYDTAFNFSFVGVGQGHDSYIDPI